MYFDTKVDVPVIPGKITISKNIYVKYETGRKYDPEKRYNGPKRVTIGKICADEDGRMYPTEKYLSYFQNEEIEDQDDRSKRSCCLRIGTYVVIKKIIKEVTDELDAENIEYKKDLRLGIMIETPAAVMISPEVMTVGKLSLTARAMASFCGSRSRLV